MSTEIDSRMDKMSFTREQNNALLRVQHEIMEQLALGTDHQQILNALCRMAENITSNSVASIMVFDDTQCFLEVLAAPSIPPEAVERLNGITPGQYSGSCGAAVYANEPQYVCDTNDDARWTELQRFAIDFNIGACWSNPIRIADQAAIGSFALSSFEAREPNEFNKRLLEICAYIAGIVIKRQREEDQLWKMAHYDVLTGLPNRSFFNDQLDYTLQIAKRTANKFALLFLDIDRFKDINDTQGHEAGDQVLIYLVQSIQACLRKGDFFARIGGDEFVLLIENFQDTDIIIQICEKISHSFNSKYTINNIDYPLSASIGISIYPEHGETAQMLLRNADTAMYAAKKKGMGNFFFYQEVMTHVVTERIRLTAEIQQSLMRRDFELCFQPQFHSLEKTLAGAEALLRWPHSSRGMIPPSEFIPVAEQSDLINELGIYVLREACRQCLVWWAEGRPKFSLAVNLSVNQLHQGFAEEVRVLLSELQFPCENLELEITESLIMKYDDLAELRLLENLGITIAMDDFGTGHSSLAQLKRLPISKLKIDRSFVKDIPGDVNDKIIAATIINMGHSLGLKVVAEGVETESQRDFLMEKGCDLLQGYLLSPPLSVTEFAAFLRTAGNSNDTLND